MRNTDRPVIEVVAALIWEGNRLLIGQRPAHKARGLLWEFVGGKVEPGETKEAALVRECREELGVTVSVGPVFMELQHPYPDVVVHLTLFAVRILQGEPQRLEHVDLRWITPEEIPQYAFCPADEPILQKLLRARRHP
jgi:8-oxo-dGTP diphosphatase